MKWLNKYIYIYKVLISVCPIITRNHLLGPILIEKLSRITEMFLAWFKN